MKKQRDMDKYFKWMQAGCTVILICCSLALFFGQTLTNRLNPFGAVLSLTMLTISSLMGISMIKEKPKCNHKNEKL